MRPTPFFHDRRDAGRILGATVRDLAGRPGVVVLGLPRGGVPVAAEVARALGAPLDVFSVRKLGLPGNAELAMGAIATGGACVLDGQTIALAGVTPAEVEAVRRREEVELERREREFRGDRPPVHVAGSVVVVVDDGMATGATMRAALVALRQRHAREIVVAVPLASPEACTALTAIADRCVCLATPVPFLSVGLWYKEFPEVTDAGVHAVLDESSDRLPEAAAERERERLAS